MPFDSTVSWRPSLEPHLRVDLVPPDLLVATSEEHTTVLQGRLLPRLAPWLDGTHTVEELAAKMGAPATVLDVRFGLSLLRDEGLLREPRAQEKATHLELPAPSGELSDRLAISISIAAIPPLEGQPFQNLLAGLLASSDVTFTGDEDADLSLVLAQDYCHPALAEIDRQARARRRPWMVVKPVGPLLKIGPCLPAEGTGCWSCLRHRLEQNQPSKRWIEQVATPIQQPRFENSSATLRRAARATAEELLRWFGGENSDIGHGATGSRDLLSLKTTTSETRRHRVVPWPACPTCGEEPVAPHRPPTPLLLEPTPRAPTSDGGFRIRPPEETLRHLHHHISPITGVVGRLRPHSLGPMQVFIADHLFRHERDERKALAAGKYQLSAGKGISADQARASALCEALERYCGIFQGDENRTWASKSELGEEASHPNECMLFSPRQLRERKSWNRLNQRHLWVPQPLDEDRQLDWSPLWSLTHHRFRYLPTAYCYYNYPLPEDFQICLADSNGCAAGSCREEAILQGFLELAERDAIALWWYHRLRRPAVDLASFDEPFFERLRRLYHGLERTLHVLDITNDLAIPAFVAVSRSPSGEILLGFGCHLDAQIAVARALTEVNQFLPGSIDGRERQMFSQALTRTAFLQPDSEAEKRRAADYPTQPHPTLDGAVRHCVTLAAALGLETLVLDQTRADIDLAVVKVAVPGLRHFWARLGPGRLYDAPLRLGWLAHAASEGELNPVHLLI